MQSQMNYIIHKSSTVSTNIAYLYINFCCNQHLVNECKLQRIDYVPSWLYHIEQINTLEL